MHRTRLAVFACTAAAAVGACGAEPPAATRSTAPSGETLLARAGDSLLAVDARSGRTLRRLALGAHDEEWRAVYTAQIDAVGGTTTITATDPASGRRLRSIEVPGRWVIPVAAGRTPEGAVSGDGNVLALAGPSGEGVSHFALLATHLGSQPGRFRLRGRYEFDALAPDASVVYLSEIRGDGRYRVRAFDVERKRLRARVVVEKTNLGLVMQGLPVTRAVDPTGSPVHTLYRGGPAGAFVHSLNTQHGTALCIFLPRSRKAGPKWRLALEPGGGTLHAVNPALDAHYVIDPAQGAVEPAAPGTALPGLETSSPDGARTYALEPSGAVAISGTGGRHLGQLPSLGADAELVAVR